MKLTNERKSNIAFWGMLVIAVLFLALSANRCGFDSKVVSDMSDMSLRINTLELAVDSLGEVVGDLKEDLDSDPSLKDRILKLEQRSVTSGNACDCTGIEKNKKQISAIWGWIGRHKIDHKKLEKAPKKEVTPKKVIKSVAKVDSVKVKYKTAVVQVDDDEDLVCATNFNSTLGVGVTASENCKVMYYITDKVFQEMKELLDLKDQEAPVFSWEKGPIMKAVTVDGVKYWTYEDRSLPAKGSNSYPWTAFIGTNSEWGYNDYMAHAFVKARDISPKKYKFVKDLLNEGVIRQNKKGGYEFVHNPRYGVTMTILPMF